MPAKNRQRNAVRVAVAALTGVFAVACQRAPAPAPDSPAAPPPAPAAAALVPPATALDDIVERTPVYLIGISFPRHLDNQPGLIALIRGYADSAHDQLRQAVAALGDAKPSAPYELSLSFDTLLDTPDLIAIAADGSCYTGGAHGRPLMARFVWLKRQQKRLQAENLFADSSAWTVVAREVAARLHQAALERAQAEALPQDEMAARLRLVDKAIADGAAATPKNFADFEPVIAADGRIGALRFVFAPYQVAPYAAGDQRVELPASLLRPLLAAEYAGLFSGA